MNWKQTRVPLPTHPRKMICSTNRISQISGHEKTSVFSVGALLFRFKNVDGQQLSPVEDVPLCHIMCHWGPFSSEVNVILSPYNLHIMAPTIYRVLSYYELEKVCYLLVKMVPPPATILELPQTHLHAVPSICPTILIQG
jgi:hypothetical protein